MVVPGALCPIVGDAGSSYMKVGFADEDIARSISPTVAGVCHPVERGHIRDVDHMSVVWNDVFQYKLGVDPSQHGLVLTESINSSPFAAAATVSSMFDTFQVPYVGLVPAPAMALYASGRETGVTLDIGGGLLQVLPIINGDPVVRSDGAGAVKHTAHLGGKDLTQRFARMLMPHRGAWLPSVAEYSVMENLKDKATRVVATPVEYDELERNPVESFTDYTMPDGLQLSVGHECLKAPESLFRAELGLTTCTVQQHFAGTMSQVNEADMAELMSNVVLSGGTTLTTGFQERVLWELKNSVYENTRVIAKPERKYLSWIGASIVSTLTAFKDSWLTAGEYMEVGESLVHRKGMFTSLRASEDDVLADSFYAPPHVKPPTKLEAIAPPAPRVAGAQNMALWRAAIEGDVGAAVIAIEMSDQDMLNSQDPHNQGFTAMHFAARYGNADVVDSLIKAGAKSTTKDDFGKTPLHWAAQYDRCDDVGAEATDLLIKSGADVNAKDNQGRTALQYAARAGQQAVVELLIAAGADAEQLDKSFRNARDWANQSITDSKVLGPAPGSEQSDSWYYNNLEEGTQ
jgi:actin